MPSSLLTLELAVPFLVPTGVAPVASVCRALREAALNNATWTEVFARRYPCLAKLPGFDKPADARGLVKSLLAAAMPQRPRITPAPRDAQGRAVPLRGDVMLAVQLLRRAKSRVAHAPQFTLTAPVPESLSEDGSIDWRFEIPFEPTAVEEKNSLLDDALGLPHSITARINDDATRPPITGIKEKILNNFNRKLKLEMFVVYGDFIHRLDGDHAGCKDTEHMDNIFRQFFRIPNLNPVPGREGAPEFPVEVEVNVTSGGRNSLIRSRLWLGQYENHDWDASYDKDQSYDLFSCNSLIEIHAYWSRLELGITNIDERRFEEDGGEDSWHWFCQLLAASPPVHFPRATS